MDSSPQVPDTVQSVADADPESSMAGGSDDESTMAEVVQAKLVENLSTFLEKERGLAMFACGGGIPIKYPDTVEYTGGDRPTDEKPAQDDKKPSEKDKSAPVEFPTAECVSPPVTLRWDAPDGNIPSGNTKLNFPLDGVTAQNLPHLLSAAAPASFGRGGENVLDETYRKALKLDTSKFSSTLNPYELGIIDTIAQLLLPSTIDSRAYRSVRAELYKLNIYSSPSGKFLPHVDTPRSPNQFGSLVVCLPLAHEGGQLIVRHKGRDFTFDFSTDAADADHASIRWAAFYSDCGHEVKESLDASHLPLYHGVEALLQDGRFMKDGGYLGLYCNHAYAYTSESGDLLPDTLKGLGMVVWETFKALGVKLFVKPVLTVEYDPERDGEEEPTGGGGVVGDKFQLATDEYGRLETTQDYVDLYRRWKGRGGPVNYKDVTWLNKPTHQELQLLFTAYGNEASVGSEYSHCAILASIPPFDSESGRRRMAVDAESVSSVTGSPDNDANDDGCEADRFVNDAFDDDGFNHHGFNEDGSEDGTWPRPPLRDDVETAGGDKEDSDAREDL
ncbi:hypothetical protein GE09DRAFT_1229243 [Coniochaeta sp. 2T2.1]|nr:hypothetical protein GE09DRAFT_1229243 [Coniochaeta sp. 2T2.1]